MPITYGSYLKIDELLSLQQPLSVGPEHDETLFIIIHQVYELWFKQLLHETDHLIQALSENAQPVALHAFKRILTILKTLVGQVDILETMTPMSFTSFRSRLENSSGFQSTQFRELEFLLGHRRPALLAHHPEGPARRRLEARLTDPSLYDAFWRCLAANGYPIPAQVITTGIASLPGDGAEVKARLEQILLDVYRTHPIVSQICERMVDLDEGLQEWRYRHVKMVERTIGTKTGTGGSSGTEYLRSTLFHPLFPELWNIRALM